MSELSSQAAVEQAIARHATDPFVVLLTIEHESDPVPIYVACAWRAVTSNGNVFDAFPFMHELPTDGEQSIEAKITVANTSRRLAWQLEKWVTPPEVTIELVLASDPDDVVRSWSDLTFTTVSYDASRITATLQRLGYFDEPCPHQRVTSTGFPGLFP